MEENAALVRSSTVPQQTAFPILPDTLDVGCKLRRIEAYNTAGIPYYTHSDHHDVLSNSHRPAGLQSAGTAKQRRINPRPLHLRSSIVAGRARAGRARASHAAMVQALALDCGGVCHTLVGPAAVRMHKN